MALDILSILVIFVNPEYLFSGIKIMISDRRNRLEILTVKALEYLKSWFKILTFIDNNNKDRRLEESIKGAPEGIIPIEILD
jgi:hypothetical protein